MQPGGNSGAAVVQTYSLRRALHLRASGVAGIDGSGRSGRLEVAAEQAKILESELAKNIELLNRRARSWSGRQRLRNDEFSDERDFFKRVETR